MVIKPRDYQIEAVQSVYQYFYKKKGNPLIAMPTGCHAYGHGILMYDGTIKQVQDIQIGDLLMGPDSKSRTVLSLARGRQEMRRICPKKGESFVVNKDHKLLLYKTKEENNSVHKCRNSRYEIITVGQYETASNWFRHLRKLVKCPVEFQYKATPLPPYFIGLMIGDGSMVNGGFNFTTKDPELAQYFTHIISSFGLITRIEQRQDGVIQLFGVDPQANRTIQNRITKIFRELELQEKRAWDKSIPSLYLINTTENRLQLLAGLLDSDGYMNLNGCDLSFVTTSEQLSKDFQFLCRSLGFEATIKKSESLLNGERKRDSYTIFLSGEFTRIPFLRKRHIELCRPRNQKKNHLMTGFTVKKLPEDEYYGFELTGDHLYLDENFIVHHNTGKALVIAMFLESIYKQFPAQRVIVLTHVKELISQNYHELKRLWPHAPAGIYSAGLNKREYHFPITFAGIGSVAKKSNLFGKIDLIIIDEAHLVSPSDDTMYQSFLRKLTEHNPNLKVIGLSATPWRLGQGKLTDDGLFTDVCFDITQMEQFNRLIDEGYLCHLIPKQTTNILDVDGVHIRGGEFVASELQLAVDKQEITYAALQETLQLASDRKHWLIFASGIEHSQHICEMLNSLDIPCTTVHSKLTNTDRDKAISGFKSGQYRAIVNNNVLTTGFNFPPIDLIVMLRPTTSPGLWVQMIGRGTRTAPGKKNCMVLDFAGNTRRLGPINDPRIPGRKGNKGGEAPVKVCQVCNVWNHASVRQCIHCGSEFPIAVKITPQAGEADLIKSDMPVIHVKKVDYIAFRQYNKADRPPMLKVTYYCQYESFSEYVCLEHEGFAKRKAAEWWRERDHTSGKVPDNVASALAMAESLRVPTHVRVWVNKQPYQQIMAYCYDGTAFGAEQVGEAFDVPEVQVTTYNKGVEVDVAEVDIPF